MMKAILRVVIGILIILTGCKAILVESGGYEVYLFQEPHVLHLVLVSALTVASFLIDFSYFKKDRNLLQFSFSLIGLVLCSIAYFKVGQRMLIDDARTVFQVGNMAGAKNVWQFDFKENKRFKLTDLDRYGQTVYYGDYVQQGDTLRILGSNYDGKANRFPSIGIIRSDTVYWEGFDTMLIEYK